ncbi:MAG: hypothetical protein IJ701_04665 [Bacteroidales bacterium]|nr:hypothetical protein [Bacteroidales bacterium]
MKRITTYFSLVALVAFAASCNSNSDPVFDDGDAFVAFDKAAASCNETDGEIDIAVTLASVKGVSTTISYEAVDGTAKAGVNYDLADGTGTLTFTPEARTQYIKVKIYDPEVTFLEDGTRDKGKYTGDLKFSLKFKSTGDVNSGADNTCTITISDLDHPLSAILGDWTFSANCRGAMASWPCEIRKDDEDDHLVWFYDLVYFSRSGWDGWDISYYGVVSEDLTTITIPLGQESEYKYSNGESVVLYAVDAALNEIFDSGNVTATISYDAEGHATGLVFNLDDTPAGEGGGLIGYIPDAGTINYVYAPYTGTKD